MSGSGHSTHIMVLVVYASTAGSGHSAKFVVVTKYASPIDVGKHAGSLVAEAYDNTLGGVRRAKRWTAQQGTTKLRRA